MENKAILEALWQFLPAKSKIRLSLCSKEIYRITKTWNINFDEEVLLRKDCIEYLRENAYERGLNAGFKKYVFYGRNLVIKIVFHTSPHNNNYLYLYKAYWGSGIFYKYKDLSYRGIKDFCYKRDKIWELTEILYTSPMICEYNYDREFLKRFKKTIYKSEFKCYLLIF